MSETNMISQIMAMLGINTASAITSLEALQKSIADTNASLLALQAANTRVNTSFAGQAATHLSQAANLQTQYAAQAVAAQQQQFNQAAALQTQYYAQAQQRATAHANAMSRVLNPNIFLHHAGWLISGAAIFATFEAMKQGLADVETGMKGLSTVLSDLAHDERAAAEAQGELLRMMRQYGANVDEVFSASRSMGRMYKDTGLVLGLVDNAIKLQIVDYMKLEDSVKANESALAIYGKGLTDSNEILAFSNHLMDSFTNLSHNAFAPAMDLSNVLQRSAAAAKQAGVGFDQLMGLAASGLRAIQRPGGEVGNMLKTIFATLSNPKDKVVEALDAVGVSVRDNNGRIKDAYTLILELSQATRNATLSQDELNNAIEQSARGIFQYSKFSALVGQYDEIVKNTALSINSQGLTLKMAGQQLDTISKKAAQTKAELVSLFSGAGDQGLRSTLKGLLDAFNQFLYGLEEVGPAAINTALALGGFLLVSKLIMGIYNAIGPVLTIASTAMAGLTTTSTAAAAAHTAQAGAANVATAATARLAAMTALATAGISLAIGAIGAYIINTGRAKKQQEQLNQEAENAIPLSIQKQQQMQQEISFLEAMAGQHEALTKKIQSGNLTEAEAQQLKKDSIAVEQAVEIALGKEAAARLETAGWTEKAINEEKAAINAKMEAERIAVSNTIAAQTSQTQATIDGALKRIEILKTEGAALRGVLAAEKTAADWATTSYNRGAGLYSWLGDQAEGIGWDWAAQRYQEAAENNRQAAQDRQQQFYDEARAEAERQIKEQEAIIANASNKIRSMGAGMAGYGIPSAAAGIGSGGSGSGGSTGALKEAQGWAAKFESSFGVNCEPVEVTAVCHW